ncbi:MAG TPA: anti-sigma factor [Thermoanaerobaculia bacterium]|nr:anti-sigma factor [Thermoanaerobaculia bacterium]
MNQPDHSIFREWLNLEVDGQLPDERRARLEDHLSSCQECQDERRDLLRVHRILERGRLPVRADFRQSVLAALPPTGWEARHPRAWRFPAAVLVLLGGAAVGLLSVAHSAAGGGGRGGSAILGALLAIGGLFRATLLAGFGLLNASWKGFGLVAGDLFASPLTIGAFGLLVVCLNLLLFSLLRRKRPVAAEASRRTPGNGSRLG